MNVDILKDNPSWYWYFLIAAAALILTAIGWVAVRMRFVRDRTILITPLSPTIIPPRPKLLI